MGQNIQRQTLGDARGFTLVEFMIAALIMTAVLGGTVALASQIQQAYSTQLDDVVVEQEVRYTLDWIARFLRSAGSNPYNVNTSDCPANGTPFAAVEMDPDGDGEDNDIRIQADISPPNGLLGGAAGMCDEEGEDVTIALDGASSTITLLDNNVDNAPEAMTEPVISDLTFTYLDTARNVTNDPNSVVFVQVAVTGRSESFDVILGGPQETTLSTEVRIRTR